AGRQKGTVMHTPDICRSQLPRRRRPGRRWLWLLIALSLCGSNGCAAFMNPDANGIPVRRLPPELLGESREGFQTIPLGLLSQRRPAVYKLGPKDVLGIWIEGVLGEKGQPPPSSFFRPELTSLEPTIGFPVPVRENGTVKLPLVPPIRVAGLSLDEAEQ